MPDSMPADAPVPRVTLSRAAILSARTLTLAFSGDAKRAVVEQAIKDGPLSNTPIGRILAETEVPIDIHWCAEERSEEHTSELQSLMRISYAVFCLKKKNKHNTKKEK